MPTTALLDRLAPLSMQLLALLQPAPYAGGGGAAAPAGGGGAGAGPAPGPGGMLGQMLFPIAIFVFFYFFIIRPQGKRQKELEAFQKGIGKGDRVVTRAGIFGTVEEVSNNVVTLKVADKVFIKFTRDAVQSKVNAEGEPIDKEGKPLKTAEASQ